METACTSPNPSHGRFMNSQGEGQINEYKDNGQNKRESVEGWKEEKI